MARRFALLLALALPSACRDARPPAPSAAENQQMDETAAMLDNLAANEAASAR